MKLTRILSALVAPVLLAACGSISMAPPETPPLLVAQEETRECGQGRVLFPAGEYRAEVVSPKGTYYKAPQRISTLGVLVGRSEEGGIFVSNAAGNPQAAWFGVPSEDVDGTPGTLFGAIGVSAPKLWPYTPRIPHTFKK